MRHSPLQGVSGRSLSKLMFLSMASLKFETSYIKLASCLEKAFWQLPEGPEEPVNPLRYPLGCVDTTGSFSPERTHVSQARRE